MQQARQLPAPPRPAPAGSEPYDSRFRRLLGNAAWNQLPEAVRSRFSHRMRGSEVALYAGEIVETRIAFAGWLLSQLCRLIGAPLPLHPDAGVPAVVVVSEDPASAGQQWTRIYHRHRGPPQLIVSAKTFSGPTGLEEHLGWGIGMALRVTAGADRLVFDSEHYFWRLGKWRFTLPGWLEPGHTRVTHRDLGDGSFAFDLEVVHPLFGRLIDQQVLFHDQ